MTGFATQGRACAEPSRGMALFVCVCVCVCACVCASVCVCVCTSQPNSDITALFDDLMLLSGGHVVYFGTWEEAVPHFAQMGFPCPAYRNPTGEYSAHTHTYKHTHRLLCFTGCQVFMPGVYQGSIHKPLAAGTCPAALPALTSHGEKCVLCSPHACGVVLITLFPPLPYPW